MKKLFYVLKIVLCILVPTSHAHAAARLDIIKTIDEIEDILPTIAPHIACGPCTLVAFDIDETLIWASDPRARSEWFNQEFTRYKGLGLSPHDALKQFFVKHLQAHNDSLFYPVDKDTNLVFELLKQQNIHIIGLTARQPLMNSITTKQFAGAHIAFPNPIPRWNDTFVFAGPEQPVLAIDGIIYSSGQDKGKTLGLFIDALSYRPQLLVMVDDMLYNVQNVQQFAVSRNIPFIGFHLNKYEKSIRPLLEEGVMPTHVALSAGSIPVK
ncbi:MAG: hypothetical protein UV79_C0004G0002 [candidate division TM6 bacterium GW2011_GWF2_43_17]|nr:MAG: hypothetical protein UV79_C0004G0002 [candidate division TM6 bacterium GW2011_GWF2_43_17]HAU30588.1 hypothetical protein [Candidatus Dependentiae bacterium]